MSSYRETARFDAEDVWSFGRNGAVKTTGIEVIHENPGTAYATIRLTPITSKGVPAANCTVRIPATAKTDLVTALTMLD